MTPEQVEEKCIALDFAVNCSIRYHDRRCSFYKRAMMFLSFLAISTSSVAVYSIVTAKETPAWVGIAFSIATAVLSAMSIVWDVGGNAERHRRLRNQFIDLAAEMDREPVTEQRLWTLRRMRLEIEKDEEAILHILNTMVHNDTLRAKGYPSSDMKPLWFFQRWLANFGDFGSIPN